jgi:hypothetical protein
MSENDKAFAKQEAWDFHNNLMKEDGPRIELHHVLPSERPDPAGKVIELLQGIKVEGE